MEVGARSGLLAVVLLACARPMPAPQLHVENRSLELRHDPAPPRLERGAHARVRAATSAPSRLFGGMMGGVVRDVASGEPIAGVTIVIEPPYPTGRWSATAISEDDGSWLVGPLPDGEWRPTIFFGELTIEVPAQLIERRARRSVDVDIDVAAAVQKTIVID